MSDVDEMMQELVSQMDCPTVHNKCPDDGTCHHGCEKRCFRVKYCGPLTGVYPNNEWPEEIRGKNELSNV